MLVSRLEVFGFKSFLEKLSLPLGGGLTAVVGPNGCGKSNIVDALRWILGETKASSLRGGSLEDVIFNGTETLRPLGLAEVSITIRSEQGSLYDEIVAQQRLLWQSGYAADVPVILDETVKTVEGSSPVESEVLESPPTEIVDLGDERPRFSIIQGRKDAPAILDATDLAHVAAEGQEAVAPAESFSAEGISGTISTEEQTSEDQTIEGQAPAANGDLGATTVPDSLKRFAWLSGVSEVQVTRRLYRSGESEFFLNKVACRLRDLKELFRVVGVAARGYTVVAQGEVTRLITAKPQERRLILEEAAGIAGFREKRSAAERRLEETGISISRIDDIVKEVARQVNSLKIHAARATNRAQLKRDLEASELSLLLDAEARIGDTVDAAKTKDAELRAEDERLSLQLIDLTDDETKLRTKDSSIEQDLVQVRQTLDTAHSILSGYVKNKSALESRKASAESALASLDREQKRTNDRIIELQTRLAESSGETEQLQAKEQELRKELAQLNTFDVNELRNAEVRLRETRQELQKKEQELRQCREKLVGEEARKKALEEQFESLHPRSSLAEIKKRLPSARNDAPWVSDLEKLLSENQFSVVAEIFTSNPRYTEALSAALDSKAEALLTDSPFELGELYARLSETRLSKECSSIMALREGSSLITGGDTAQSAAARQDDPSVELFAKKKLINNLVFKPQHVDLANHLLGDVYLAESYQEARELLTKLSASCRVITLTGEVLTAYGVQVRREGRGIVAVKGELEATKERCVALTETVKNATEIKSHSQQQVHDAEEAHSIALKASQERQRRARELSSEHGVLLGKLHIAQRMRGQSESDLKGSEQQLNAFQNQANQRTSELGVIQQELAALSAQDEKELEAQVASAKEAMKLFEEEASVSRTELREKSRSLLQTRNQLDLVRRDLTEASLTLQRVTIELEGRREQFVREYPETSISDEKKLLSDDMVQELRGESQKLRARLVREGDVDPTAPDRLAEEVARLNELEMQRNDLEAAATALRETIAELAETSRERFEKLFVSVAKNFSELVAKLFGGGAGELTLSDPTNPLESGIELYVRPPGKKPKSIDLLSGGEKTLCALALMIALFLERPSPLCVLDEVDAPLDEANLQRFVGLVKEMSAKTQFVMVTHNKQTMSVADRLIGVTMPQAGASKVLAVSLDEAYQAVA